MIIDTRGAGTPLVLIHGFGVDHRIMQPLEDLADLSGWRRIYLDLPWAEGSDDRSATSPRDVADAALAEITREIGSEPFAVIGNSFGAMVARHAAHAMRDQCIGLATLAGVFVSDHSQRRLPEHRVIQRDERILECAGDWREQYEEMSVVHSEATLRAFERSVLPGLRASDQEIMERISARYTEAYAPEIDASAPFPAPALHVFGRQDQVVGFEDGFATSAHYPRGTFVALDGAGHNLHLERPSVVGALVSDWLDRVRQFAGAPGPTGAPASLHTAPEHGVASGSWDERIDQFWERADDADPAGTLDALRPLVAERGPNDPDGVYEWASVHDFLGREKEAIPLYEAALAANLAGARRPQAVIQLASSLRNVGRAAEAAALLRGLEESPDRDAAVGDAHRAFLALALRDMGQPDEALRLALLALAPTLPRYRRSVAAYAQSLAARPENGE